MAHRPYPAAAKTWRQIMRRYRYDRPPHLPAPRPPQDPVGQYVLTTRTEGVDLRPNILVSLDADE